MAAIGPAMVFIGLLLMECLLGAMLLVYAARCLGVIVEGTAAGEDEVTWPDEPMMDWLGRALHLVWLVAFWLAPVALVLRVVRQIDPEAPSVLLFLPPVVLFWLLFPVSVLSSLSAHSRWVVFRPALVGGLFRVFPATAAFYFSTALLLAGLAALGATTFANGLFLLIPVLAVAGAAGLFIYARLLGRLGWALGRIQAPEEPEVKPTAAQRQPPRRRPRKRRPARGVKTTDPWAVPEKEEAPPLEAGPPVEAYGVAGDEPARPAAPRPPQKGKTAPREEGYALSSEQAPPPPKEAPLDGYLPVGADAGAGRESAAGTGETTVKGQRPNRSLRLSAPRQEPPPAHLFLQGVYTFPWYGTSAGPWLAVALALLAMGGILQGLLSVWASLQGAGS
jgi:hypothetical protein